MTPAGVGAGLMTLAAAAVALGGLFVLAVPVDGATFAEATDVDWDAFASAQPSVAEHLRRVGRLLGLSNVAVGLLSLGLARSALWSGDRRARWLVWILPAYLIAVVLVVGTSEPAIAVFYAVLAVVAVAGLLLVDRARHADASMVDAR